MLKTIRQSEKWSKDILFFEFYKIIDNYLGKKEKLLFLILGRNEIIKKYKNIFIWEENLSYSRGL